MPSKPLRTPDRYVPSAEDLLGLVRRRPGASLRELCAALWPDLPWTGGTGADSATMRTRTWQAPTGRGRPGNRVEELTAAVWLRERLAELVEAGELAHAPRRRDEVDLLASLSYVVPGVVLVAAADALEAIARSRRAVTP